MTIWGIGTGDYDDYHIVLICATKELAEAQAALWNGDRFPEYRVEEFPYTDRLLDDVVYYSATYGDRRWSGDLRDAVDVVLNLDGDEVPDKAWSYKSPVGNPPPITGHATSTSPDRAREAAREQYEARKARESGGSQGLAGGPPIPANPTGRVARPSP